MHLAGKVLSPIAHEGTRLNLVNQKIPQRYESSGITKNFLNAAEFLDEILFGLIQDDISNDNLLT